MKLRNITSIFVMMAVASAAYAIPDSALIYMTGGGGSVKPAATNAVLEAAMAYTDGKVSPVAEAITNLTWGSNAKVYDPNGMLSPMLLSDTFVTPYHDDFGFGSDWSVDFGDPDSQFYVFSGAAYEYAFTNMFGEPSYNGGTLATNVVVDASFGHINIQRVTPPTPTSWHYFLIEFKALKFPRSNHPVPPSGCKTFYFVAKIE